ncbi:AbaSI family restriction endonuclease [Shewanella pneumatophori]|uniref:SET and RING associated domain-containing protein n=1 Tax=Shewanella pneumatophori TaxID=314092 RepID=A0A9X2CHI8_9GAMM|nr:hypothetical protein [Shewanella pneumatophori]MCL1138530.1 hypothetical protein [Shewanella pneumatophori]
MTRQLQRCKNKRFELYAITRIIHKVDDLDVKFVTQQYVARPNGFALTDLYLPQLKLHIEIDEGFHQGQIDTDKIRELDIITATDHLVRRIDAAVSIEQINIQVDKVVADIQQMIADQKILGCFQPWNPELEHSVEYLQSRGSIKVSENVALRTSAEVCNLFGHQYKGWQRSSASIPKQPNIKLWFPKLYPNEQWFNEISHDGTEIHEYCLESEAKKREVIDRNFSESFQYVVFARVKDELGQTMYRFKGVFELDRVKTSYEAGVFWKQIAIDYTF